jgi:hypothetical protein
MKKFILSFLLLLLPGVTYAVTLDADGQYSWLFFSTSQNDEDYAKLTIQKGEISVQDFFGLDALINYATNRLLEEVGIESDEEPVNKEFIILNYLEQILIINLSMMNYFGLLDSIPGNWSLLKQKHFTRNMVSDMLVL